MGATDGGRIGATLRAAQALGARSARGRRTLWLPLAAMAVALLLPLLAGCKIQMNLDTTIGSDGSGTVGVHLSADKEIQDLMASQGGGGDLFSEFAAGVPEGWDSDSGTDPDGTRWVKASRTFDDPSEIMSFLQQGDTSPAESLGAQEFSLTQEKGRLSVKTVFSAKWDMSTVLAATGEQAPEGIDPAALSSIFEIQNRLTLPGSIKENNADEVDGNTLIWRPSLSGATEMNAISVAYRWPVIGGIVAAVLVLLALIVGIVLILRRGRHGTVPLPASPGYTPPNGPLEPNRMPAPPTDSTPVETPPWSPPPPPEQPS